MKTALLTRSFGKRSFAVLIAMLAIIALTLPSFADEDETHGDDSGIEETHEVAEEEAEIKELEAEIKELEAEIKALEAEIKELEGEEPEGEEPEDEEEYGSARSIEVHMLKYAGCSPSRGIGFKVGHEENGKYEDCDIPQLIEDELIDDGDDAWKNPGKGREKSKSKHGSEGSDDS